ncbi:hypothetical protein JW960_12135 [candidate division KSB1 bacterium]|nr:hypothetical protein [candidate division KSB1 bacterium]
MQSHTPKILGIHLGYNASACLLGDDIASLAEENITRVKNYQGFPFAAIGELLNKKNTTFAEIDIIAIAGTDIQHENSYRFESYFAPRYTNDSNSPDTDTLENRFMYPFRRVDFHSRLKSFLSQQHFSGNIVYLDHHLCQCAAALATFAVENGMAISMDDGDNGTNWKIFSIEKGMLKLLAESTVDSYKRMHATPANVCLNTTQLLGFNQHDYAGKVTGLSAYGQPIFKSIFDELLSVNDGQFRSEIKFDSFSPWNKIKKILGYFTPGTNDDVRMINYLRSKLPRHKYSDIAASLQQWTESILLEFIEYYRIKFSSNQQHLLLSGNMFSNVLLNQKIAEFSQFQKVDAVPVTPSGSLAIGACYLMADETQKKTVFSKPFQHVYLGPHYPATEIKANLSGTKQTLYTKSEIPDQAKFIAQALSLEYIVGLFGDRMEFSSHALGARSIVASPANPNINTLLNQRLQRTEFMPFAQCMRDVDALFLLEGYSPGDLSAQFMTRTYRATDKLLKIAPAIVHVDGTTLPQVVTRNINLLFYDILTYFQELTGIPVLINTSFNIHAEPVLLTPQDALRSYVDNNLVDILVLEDFIVTSPDKFNRIRNQKYSKKVVTCTVVHENQNETNILQSSPIEKIKAHIEPFIENNLFKG